MSALPALVSLSLSFASGATVGNLRCEYLTNPNSIDVASPRLSWITRSAANDWRQSAFQILVASDAQHLARDQGDLWDSGKVNSDASLLIPYLGKALQSNEQCFWKVRVWDAGGKEASWSPVQTWQMGLLAPTDWGGSQWIGAEKSEVSLPAPFLRKEFVAQGNLKRARLFASGLGYAELHLNGKKLGENVERDPGYTNFDKRVLYVAHDVTPLIHPGRNALGAVLGTGWYDVHDQATWRFERAPWRGRPRMRLVLLMEFADGRKETVVSDGSWKFNTGPILSDGIYSGETYDARREMPAWDKVGFDEKGWSGAMVQPAPKGILAARLCPPVTISETIKAKKIYEPRPGVYVVDFGQNISGHVRLKVQGPAGSKVTLKYSERIREDKNIERSQIDVYMDKQPPQIFQTDTYILKGTGREEWEQRFSYSGFRYVEVTGFPGTPTLANFEARFAHTDLPSGGTFECSNDLLNKIQRATLYSYLSNAQSIFTDCPQREKNGWTGDAQLAGEAGLMNFDSASLYTKWLNDLADDQQERGSMSLIVPSGGWGRGATHPAWDSAFEILADDLYRYQGDTRALTEKYDHLRRYVDFLSAQCPDDVVPFDSLGDWLPWQTETPSQLTSTVYLYVDARIVAKAARMRGDNDAAQKYDALADRVKTAFNKTFFSADKLASSSQAALSIAIYFDLLEGGRREAAFAELVRNVERQGHIDTGILGAKYILRVLSENGRTDLAYKLVARKEQPGWGWWISQGATTLWEDWKGESSLNHIMFGDVSNWFYQWIAGIGLDPKSPAFKHILIRPQVVGDLTWAKATENSPYGKIASSWRRKENRLHLDIEIPANTTATVWVPGVCEAPKGLKVLRVEPAGSVLEVGSGKYGFDSVLAK